MKKLAISSISALICIASSAANAQSCSVGATTLSTQSQIDSFEDSCTDVSVTGNLTIQSSPATDITNLDGLAKITGITGNLYLNSNTGLSDINGLGNVGSIGGFLRIRKNDALQNLDGLNLSSVGNYIRIQNNAVLQHVDSLSSLTTLPGFLRVDSNPGLTSVAGFANITNISGYLRFVNNDALTNIDALALLTTVGGNVNIRNNNLLANLNGLSGLTSVGDYFRISNNDDLKNLDALANLISVSSYVQIDKNDELASCTGIIPLADSFDDGVAGPGPDAGTPPAGSISAPDAGGFITLTNNGGAECDTITAALATTTAPGFNQAFDPVIVRVGQSSTLTLSINNSRSPIRANTLDFTNTLPTDVVIATPANASTTCTGGTLTATSDTAVFGYTGGSVDGNASCEISVDVVAQTQGTFRNITGELTSGLGNSGTSKAKLTSEDIVRTYSSTLPSGGSGTLSFTTADPTCSFTGDPQFLAADAISPPPPSQIALVHGVVQFSIDSCSPGATVEMTMDYGSDIPEGAAYWKAGDPWREISSVISGTSVVFSLTDGSESDDDGVANGTIVDPSGIATPSASATSALPPEEIPVLPPFLLALMSLGVALLGGLASRRS